MFKRILKMVSIALAAFIGAVGIGVGVFAISGGFKEETIDILKLYIANDAGNEDLNKEQIYTLTDVTRMIKCVPENATNKTLEVVINDPLVKNDTEYTGGILKNPPKEIEAGEEFKLEINKDKNGNNIGGVVNVTIRPKGKVGITDVTLKVVVDTAIPNNSIYFSNNVNDSFSSSGNNVIMAQSSYAQNVYLKSNLVNAFNLEVSNKTTLENYKNVTFSYDYYDENGSLRIPEGTEITNATLDKVFDEKMGLYNYYYKIPVVLDKPGYVVMYAKMHKTYSMEKDYIAGDFDNMLIPTTSSSLEFKQQAQAKLDNYNAFLNKYREYIDNTQESNDFFRSTLEMVNGESTPKISLQYNEIARSKKFIFQTTSFTVNISAVNLNTIKSNEVPQQFKVLSTQTYTLDQLKTQFKLKPSLINDKGVEIFDIPEAELKSIFDTLEVNPFVYVERETYETNKELWSDYLNHGNSEIYGVDGFKDNKPDDVLPLTIADMEGFAGNGFLIKLSKVNNNYADYISIKKGSSNTNKTWEISFNIPMKTDATPLVNTGRALFLQFKVKGMNLNTSEPIERMAYTRVFIDYTDYDFRSDKQNISFEASTFKNVMAINSQLSNASEYPEKPNEQIIDINLDEIISNYNSVEYKRVMYFVEQNSNYENDYQKVLTVGKYKFKTLDGSEKKVTIDNQEEVLIGERLLNRGTFDNPEYFIHAINASATPVRIFAVVYLSDAYGNPIDLNGRRINIDETSVGDPTELVVFAITDITSTEEIQINSFISNLNYYTYMKNQGGFNIEYVDTLADGSQRTVTYSVGEGDLFKRNNILSYATEDGQFDEETVTKLRDFLKIKMLSDAQMQILVSNFELDAAGNRIDEDIDYLPIFDIKDFYGNKLSGLFFKINTINNKQLAFNVFADKDDFIANYTIQGFNFQSNNFEIMTDGGSNGAGLPISIKLRLSATEKTTDSIRITSTSNSLPDNLNSEDYVNWQVSEVYVTEVELSEDGVQDYYKLYAEFSDSSDVKFVTTQLGNNRSNTDYYLYAKDSKDETISFNIKTNLYVYDESNNKLPDLSIVDPSQAIVTGGTIDEGNFGVGQLYADIESYIAAKCYNTIPTFLTNNQTIMLAGDLIFKVHEGYLNVGGKKFLVNNGNVTINNKVYAIVDDKLVVNAGEYFPVVNTSDSYYGEAIIMGESFKISKDENNDKYYISNQLINDNGNLLNAEVLFDFKINTSDTKNYSAHDYLIDGSETQSTDVASALDIIKSDKFYAMLRFQKGGTVKTSNGEYVYVEDSNGYYKLVDGEYVFAEDSENVTRYSRKGIKTFLMITFSGTCYEKPITKVITYELVQEMFNINFINSNNGSVIEYNSSENKMVLPAGEISEISLNGTGGKSIYVDHLMYRSSLFEHAEYTLSSQGGVQFLSRNGQNKTTTITKFNFIDYKTDQNSLRLDIPSTDKSQVFTMTIKYRWITESNEIIEITKIIYFEIKNDFSFRVNDNITNDDKVFTEDDNAYNFYLEVNTDYNIKDLINNYFEFDGGVLDVNLNLPCDYATLDNDILTIGNSYGEFDGTEVKLDSFTLSLKLSSGSKIFNINKSVKIHVLPEYVVDFTNAPTSSSPKNMLKGDNLYDYDYIKLYNFDEESRGLGSLVSGRDKYIEIFTLTTDVDGQEGKVSLSNTSSNYRPVSISYQDGNKTISKTIYLNMIEYKVKYNVSGNSEYKETLVSGSTVNIYIPEEIRESYEGLYSISNYFKCLTDDTTKVDETPIEMSVVLVDNSGNIKISLIGLEGSYKLYIAQFNGSSYELLVEYATIEVHIVELYASEGLFNNTHTREVLAANNDYVLHTDITITANAGETIDVSKYYRFFIGNQLATIVFGNTEVKNNEFVVPEQSTEYDVYFRQGNTNLRTNYKVIFNVKLTITIDENTTYSLDNSDNNNFFETYLSGLVKSGKTLTAVIKDTSSYASISENTLTVGNSYGEYTGSAINLDSFTLVVSDGSNKTEVLVYILPTYVIDLTNIDNKSVLSNESIYDYDYVKIYNYDKENKTLGSLSTVDYTQIFTLKDAYNVVFKDGILADEVNVAVDEIFEDVTISYKEGLNDSNINSKTFNVTVCAYEVTYKGKEVSDLAELENLNIAIVNPEEGSSDYALTKYFDVKINTTTNYPLILLLVDNGDIKYTNISELNGSYKLYVAKEIVTGANPEYKLLSELSSSVKVTPVWAYLSENGNFGEGTDEQASDFETLKEIDTMYLDKNIEISGVDGTEIDVDKYYVFYLSDGTKVTPCFNNGNYNETLTISAQETEYYVCFDIDGVKYNTVYTVKLKPEASQD